MKLLDLVLNLLLIGTLRRKGCVNDFDLNARISKVEVTRLIRRGNMSLSLEEGDMRANVSPSRRAGGKTPASLPNVILVG